MIFVYIWREQCHLTMDCNAFRAKCLTNKHTCMAMMIMCQGIPTFPDVLVSQDENNEWIDLCGWTTPASAPILLASLKTCSTWVSSPTGLFGQAGKSYLHPCYCPVQGSLSCCPGFSEDRVYVCVPFLADSGWGHFITQATFSSELQVRRQTGSWAGASHPWAKFSPVFGL